MADYLIPEPTEIIDGTSVTKIYQRDENKWWGALKPKDSKYKWWAIGAMVSNTDGKNVPIIISNIKENCQIGRIIYDSYNDKYTSSNYSAYQASFAYSGNTLYCSVPDMVAVTDNKLDSLVPILSGSYDMTNKDVIISVAKTIVGNYVNSGGTIPSAELIEPSESYQKVDYTPIGWQDDGPPDIDAKNLGKMDAGIARLFEELKNIKKNYQEVLDDIYDAIVSRGLVFPKENVKDYAAQIYKLKKVDLDIQLQAALAMTEITERVLPVERLKDSVQSSLQVPEKYGLSDALDELCVSAGGNVEIIESLQVSLQTE